MKKKIIKTFDQAKNKEVTCGYVLNGEYVRKVKNEHYMVKYAGYGIQMDVMNKIFLMGVKKIRLIAQTCELESDMYTWANKGKKDKFGHGEQLFLPASLMVRSAKGVH